MRARTMPVAAGIFRPADSGRTEYVLAKERGDTRVIWTTGEQNAGSQRFYDRLGMRREKKVYFVMDP